MVNHGKHFLPLKCHSSDCNVFIAVSDMEEISEQQEW